MSYRLNIGITIGTLAIMLLTTSVIIFFTKDTRTNQEIAKTQSEQNAKDIKTLKADFKDFVDMWEKRIQTSNKVNNQTQLKIENGVDNVLGNLTAHRHVTNYTRDIGQGLQNQTLANQKLLIQLINQTKPLTTDEFNKISDKKINDIVNWVVGNLTEDGSKRLKVK